MLGKRVDLARMYSLEASVGVLEEGGFYEGGLNGAARGAGV